MTGIDLSPNDILNKTRAYLLENFLYAQPDFELNQEDSLLQKGVLDSMGVIEVLEFLQDEFGVQFEDDEITEENLGSLSAIAKYISTKRQATAS